VRGRGSNCAFGWLVPRVKREIERSPVTEQQQLALHERAGASGPDRWVVEIAAGL